MVSARTSFRREKLPINAPSGEEHLREVGAEMKVVDDEEQLIKAEGKTLTKQEQTVKGEKVLLRNEEGALEKGASKDLQNLLDKVHALATTEKQIVIDAKTLVSDLHHDPAKASKL